MWAVARAGGGGEGGGGGGGGAGGWRGWSCWGSNRTLFLFSSFLSGEKACGQWRGRVGAVRAVGAGGAVGAVGAGARVVAPPDADPGG